MNATVLNGALPGDAFLDEVQDLVVELLGEEGFRVRPWVLREEKVGYCMGCFECWTATPGLCRIPDAGRDVAASLIRSDLAVCLTPVTFGGYSSELKKAVDRTICLISPFFKVIGGEVHHHRRYRRYPALLGIGVLPGPHAGQERIFGELIERHAINMHAPRRAHAVFYRNQAAAEIRTSLAALLDAVGMADRETQKMEASA